MNVKINSVKISVTIPKEKVDDLRNAICKAGAGVIGNYTYCTMATKCFGTFKPNEKAEPYIGEKNKLEFVGEVKLETTCKIDLVKKIIKVIKRNHPYEEPVIELIPLMKETDFK